MKEDLIRFYLTTFFDSDEQRKQFINAKAIDCIYEDNATIEEWNNITKQYKSLLPFGHLNDYRFEVGESGSFFIKNIFEKYVDDDTFVLSSRLEHDIVKYCLKSVKHQLKLGQEEVFELNVEKIYSEFKKSGCKKFLLYMVGTTIATGEIMPQSFFEKLKEILVKNNIEHKMILDDVHGMFVTPRDYSIFDAIVFTAHSWLINFNMGVLFTKLPDKIGYMCKENPIKYLDLIKIVISKFDKVRQFKNIMIEYFSEELSDKTTFGLYDRTTPHIFSLVTYGLIFHQKEYESLLDYHIRLGETLSYKNFAKIRFQEFIIKNPNYILEGLNKLKSALRKYKRIKDTCNFEIVWDDKQNIQKKHLADPNAKLDVEL